MKPIPLANARGSVRVAIAVAAGTFAAAAAQTLSFEVASVKPSPPSPDGRVLIMVRGGPGTSDPGQITYQGRSLKDLISSAYGVKSFQVSGPGWLDTERYDITAKIPEGTTKEQFNVMMQNLLAERFKLALHRETATEPRSGATRRSRRARSTLRVVDGPSGTARAEIGEEERPA